MALFVAQLRQETLKREEAQAQASVHETNVAAAAGLAQLREKLEKEKQENEARWHKRYEAFKSESVVVLANSSSALEVRAPQAAYCLCHRRQDTALDSQSWRSPFSCAQETSEV